MKVNSYFLVIFCFVKKPSGAQVIDKNGLEKQKPENLGYSLHTLRLRSSCIVWFKTALSSNDLIVETGKQTTTLPR